MFDSPKKVVRYKNLKNMIFMVFSRPLNSKPTN